MSIPQLLHIQLFGVLRAERDGQPVAFPRRKAEALLAYLLLHPGPHPREQIAALFWGDGDGAGSQSSGGNCTFSRAAAARISAWRQSGIAPFRFHVWTVVI